MTSPREIGVRADAVPTVTNFIKRTQSRTAPELVSQGVDDGPAQRYIRAMNVFSGNALSAYRKHQRELSTEAKHILESMNELLEAEAEASDLLKSFLRDLESTPLPEPPGGQTGKQGFV